MSVEDVEGVPEVLVQRSPFEPVEPTDGIGVKAVFRNGHDAVAVDDAGLGETLAGSNLYSPIRCDERCRVIGAQVTEDLTAA